jgi:hypothetical protein
MNTIAVTIKIFMVFSNMSVTQEAVALKIKDTTKLKSVEDMKKLFYFYLSWICNNPSPSLNKGITFLHLTQSLKDL